MENEKNRKTSPLLALISPTQFILGVLLAFIAGAVFLWVFGESPADAYGALFKGAFSSKRYFAETLLSTTPLIFGGLAVALGFRCGLFNMGVEGQIVLGGMAAAYVGYAWELPLLIHLPLALLAGAVAGGIWGAIPGYLKAKHRIHEVITTIMLNYIVFQVAAYMIAVGGPMKADNELPVSPDVLPTAQLARIWEGTRLSGGIFIALIFAVLVWVFLFKTRLGYKMRAVGLNSSAAEFAGIKPGRMMVWAMFLSGALGGLAGAVEVLGVHYKFYSTFSPGYGWDAIAVALLGLNHPVGVVASAFLFGVLRSGSITMQAIAQISKDIVLILSALIIFFTATNQTLRPILERLTLRLDTRRAK
ncbi:MAG TPA: ABC transporter permease [Chloroflexi bacterium]|nr:MAG: ABC transporter permease [Chloroflexota bacterium]HDD54815.1 ABC transporter permease [Chloroflexota bacterium]